MEQYHMSQESISMPLQTVDFVARLAIGENDPSRVKSNLETEEQLHDFARSLAESLGSFTNRYTADCMEDRRNIAVGSVTDQGLIEARVVPQLPGGLGLAAAKAASAANAAVVREAKNLEQAYVMVMDVLGRLGYSDGGHRKCGAGTFARESVEQPVATEILLPTTSAVFAINKDNEHLFHEIQANKQRKLDAGYYASWNLEWYENRLQETAPENLIEIETKDTPTHGHEANGVILLDNIGFKKNQFIRSTGAMAFAATRSQMAELAGILGGTDEEQARLRIAFADDLINVSDKIVAKDMPVFAAAA
jgi:hypothetical protein